MKKTDTLFLFTISFPIEEGEPFLNNEFPYLLENFKNINIVSSANKSNNPKLNIPVNVFTIWDILKTGKRKKVFIQNFFLISRILINEFFHCKSKIFFLKNSREYLNILINSCICSDYLIRLPDFNRNAAFYSFWMNHHAVTLAVMKMQGRIDHFVLRVHGYDLILERWPHHYIAFQKTCHKMADRILTVSKKSLDYFVNTYGLSNKADFTYLGTIDNGINPISNKEDLMLVSCSNIIPLKRLELIIEILKQVNVKVKWVHFGEGYTKKEILEQCSSLPQNIIVEFKGQVSQQELFEFYRNNPIHYFINVSNSEGLPFTIIEAISFGIPIIATNVGGTSEIVNDKTGILLDEDFDTTKVAHYFNDYVRLPYSASSFREGVREFWKNNFFAGIVYPHFINKNLINLGNL